MNPPPLPDLSRPTPVPQPHPVTKAATTAWTWKHAALYPAVLAAGVGAGSQVPTAPAPVVPKVTVEKKAEAVPAPKPAEKRAEEPPHPAPPKAPDWYAKQLQEAWDIEGDSSLGLRRLLALYRSTRDKLRTAKKYSEVKAWFDAEEKRLEMAGRVPMLRHVVHLYRAEKFPDPMQETITEDVRARKLAFYADTIAALEALK